MTQYLGEKASHTMIETAKRCPKKAEYRYVRGYKPLVKGVKLERGTWIHELLAEFYRDAMKHGGPREAGLVAVREKHDQLVEEKWKPLFDEEKESFGFDFPDECLWITQRYVEKWLKQDRQQIAKVLFVERLIPVKIPELPIPLQFKCDLIYLNKLGMAVIVDHKVTGSIPDEEDRMLDSQGPRYVLGLTEFLRQRGVLHKVKGVIMVYDYIRDRTPAIPTLNKNGTMSKANIDTEWDVYRQALLDNDLDPNDYQDMLDKIARTSKPFFDRWVVPISDYRIQAERAELMADTERGLLEQRKVYPRNLDRLRCRWDCEYKDLCLVELQGGDIEPLLKSRFEVRDRSIKSGG